MTKPLLSKLVLMLSSDQDGEVVNAARAIGKALKKAGLDWHALAKAADNLGVEKEARKFSGYAAGGWPANHDRLNALMTMVNELSTCTMNMTIGERVLVYDLVARYRIFGSDTVFSVKQEAWVRDLHARACEKAATQPRRKQ